MSIAFHIYLQGLLQYSISSDDSAFRNAALLGIGVMK